MLGPNIVQFLIDELVGAVVYNVAQKAQVAECRFLLQVLVEPPGLEQDVVDDHLDEHKHYYLHQLQVGV